jgi:hypothetical protein
MQKKRREVIQGVLEEQHRQKHHRDDNPELIRAASTKGSSWANSRALLIGNNDAKEVGCPPSSLFQNDAMFDFDIVPMDVDDVSSSIPSLCGLSYDSTSTTSEGTDDFSWAEKLMVEDLIPDL